MEAVRKVFQAAFLVGKPPVHFHVWREGRTSFFGDGRHRQTRAAICLEETQGTMSRSSKISQAIGGGVQVDFEMSHDVF